MKTLQKSLIEFLVIAFSILAAFWLEDYRQAREDDKIRLEYYKRVIDDLKNDIKEWNKFKYSVKYQKGLIDSLIRNLSNPSEDLDRITEILFRFESEMFHYDIYEFIDESYAIRSIENNERGIIFENDSTFENLQKYYSLRKIYINDIESYEVYFSRYITPYMDKYFDRSCIRFSTTKKFLVEFIDKPNYDISNFQNTEFINYLINAGNRLLLENYVNYIIERCNEVIELVEERIEIES